MLLTTDIPKGDNGYLTTMIQHICPGNQGNLFIHWGQTNLFKENVISITCSYKQLFVSKVHFEHPNLSFKENEDGSYRIREKLDNNQGWQYSFFTSIYLEINLFAFLKTN